MDTATFRKTAAEKKREKKKKNYISDGACKVEVKKGKGGKALSS